MTFTEKWIEHDYNPFIVFNPDGKVLSLNSEAQFLLGQTTPDSLFKIASSYASTTYGFKTTFVDLEFGRFKFFAITIGYDSEEEIGIKLYQTPIKKFESPKHQGELVNIYTLIDLCISSNSINTSTTFVKELDPTLPELRLHTELFIKLLNKIYASVLTSERICTNLHLRVGEYIKFEEKKYTIFTIKVSYDKFDNSMEHTINYLAKEQNLYVNFSQGHINIDIPLMYD